MKRTGVLINVGRGPVVQEAALVDALRSGAIGGAALDVFETEPLPPESPLWSLENVLLSPHCADQVQGWLEPAMACFRANLERFLAGAPLQNVVRHPPRLLSAAAFRAGQLDPDRRTVPVHARRQPVQTIPMGEVPKEAR